MPEIAIRLDPAELANPDLDLRYALPDALMERAPELLLSNGYDYDPFDCIIVFLLTERPDEALAFILPALAELELLGNRFVAGVTVAVAEEPDRRHLDKYRIVSPQTRGTLADPAPGPDPPG
jgi:hypothetical protein